MAAPITNIATNITTFVFVKPAKASAGFITPVTMREIMIPAEMMEKEILPDRNATMVHARIISVISNGVIRIRSFIKKYFL